MNPYAAQRLTQDRTTQLRAEAARRGRGAHADRRIRRLAGWALIQIGLALVTSSARRQHATVSPELP